MCLIKRSPPVFFYYIGAIYAIIGVPKTPEIGVMTMRITEVTDQHIKFTNGSAITFSHPQDCCEDNYADFKQLEECALNTEFNEKLIFEAVEGSGFRFGSEGGYVFFVPCYSEQNGYYDTEIDIYYNGKRVLNIECELVLD
jgi:hypothetical protein